MDSRKQYMELFDGNREAIDAGSAPVMNALRGKAAVQFGSMPFHRKGEEGYKRTDVNEMFAPDYGVNVNRVNIPVDVARSWRCDVPNMSTLLGVVVNDAFVASQGLAERLPKGVTFCSLRQAALQQPELVAAHYGTLAEGADAAVALNTMLAQDGVFIHVEKNVRLEKPLQLVNIFSAPMPLLAPRRVLIVMEEGAEARLLVCDHTQDAAQKYLSAEVVEVVMKPGSRFDYYTIEESSGNTGRYSQMFVRQEEGSNIMVNNSMLTCGCTRNNYSVDLTGEHCEARLAGMAIASGRMKVDNAVNMRHLAPRCKSDQLFKYVADDESQCAFQGLILVDNKAPFTDAYQTCRSVLASTEARMFAKPQLEIYNDEVKCSHGATTGQLDAEALFYMRTRGIPEAEARTMLMQAFMSDVIDTVRLEGLRDRLRHLVEKRFSGVQANCADCHTSCKNADNEL
ncbi:MAG: Fe-S cluster assembly protein SufD [Firmicutes bacterium]|nr:Fe-S cluster assembly protein SufD [Bacillota bacterium]MCM1400522.1 Fe-S cluster assembly protein SufD [Bacteroides sp.]